jgi:hypothetical protein
MGQSPFAVNRRVIFTYYEPPFKISVFFSGKYGVSGEFCPKERAKSVKSHDLRHSAAIWSMIVA